MYVFPSHLIAGLVSLLPITALVAQEGSEPTPSRRHDPIAIMERAYQLIELVDGVDEGEARVLASAYLSAFVSGCGGPATPADNGTFWLIATQIGRGATPGPDVLVDRVTGTVGIAGGHQVSCRHVADHTQIFIQEGDYLNL
jgi:hypothetical protein